MKKESLCVVFVPVFAPVFVAAKHNNLVKKLQSCPISNNKLGLPLPLALVFVSRFCGLFSVL